MKFNEKWKNVSILHILGMPLFPVPNPMTEKVVRSKIELGLPFVVLYLGCKFRMISLKRTCY